MTLPPVVSDPELCPVRWGTRGAGLMPHDWQHMDEDHEPTDYWQCRFCGGRKPDESDDYQSPLQERFRHGMHPE